MTLSPPFPHPPPPPQEFLKKEFSAENLTFWKACERFQQIPASDIQQVGKGGARAERWDQGLGSASDISLPLVP